MPTEIYIRPPFQGPYGTTDEDRRRYAQGLHGRQCIRFKMPITPGECTCDLQEYRAYVGSLAQTIKERP